MAEGFDDIPAGELEQADGDGNGRVGRLEARMEEAFGAADAKLTSLETRISSGFSRLECRLDRLFELQRRRRSASE